MNELYDFGHPPYLENTELLVGATIMNVESGFDGGGDALRLFLNDGRVVRIASYAQDPDGCLKIELEEDVE